MQEEIVYKLLLHEKVKTDISDALDYYDTISPTLGVRFEKALYEAMDKLEEHPEYYFKLNTVCRRIKLLHFPYMLIYYIQKPATVFIVGLFHLHQSAERFQQRLK